LRRTAALFLVALLACGTRRDADEDPIGRTRGAIQGGKADTSSTFAVAVLDDQGGTCSGTLIAPNLVLTARHCVATDNGGDAVDCSHDAFNAPGAATSLRVSDANEAPSFVGAEYGVKKVVVPTETLFCGHDIALLVLDKNMKSATPAAPAIDTNHIPATVDAIGYGITSPTGQDEGTRRRRDAIPIECVPGTTAGCTAADYAMVTNEIAAGDGLCDGDSGSGAYDPSSITAGTPKVVGVLSRGADSGSTCAEAVYERVDAFGPLLVATAKDAATAGGYTLPEWAGGPAQQKDAGASEQQQPGDPSASEPPAAAPPSSGGSSGGCRASPTREIPVFAMLLVALVLLRRK
jgi:hypothetical protein